MPEMAPRRRVVRRLALGWAALLCDALPCAGSGASPALLRFMQGGRGKKSGAEAEEQPPPAPKRAQEEERPCSLIKLDARELSAARFRREFQGREPVLLTHAAEGWGRNSSRGPSWWAPDVRGSTHFKGWAEGEAGGILLIPLRCFVWSQGPRRQGS